MERDTNASEDPYINFLNGYVQALEESGVPEYERIVIALTYAERCRAEEVSEEIQPLVRFYQEHLERGMPSQLLVQSLEEAYRIALKAKAIKDRVRATLEHVGRVFNFQRVNLQDPKGLLPEGLEQEVSELGFMGAVYSLPGERQITEFTGAEIEVIDFHR